MREAAVAISSCKHGRVGIFSIYLSTDFMKCIKEGTFSPIFIQVVICQYDTHVFFFVMSNRVFFSRDETMKF